MWNINIEKHCGIFLLDDFLISHWDVWYTGEHRT